MLPLASSVIDHIRRQKVAVTSVTLGCTLCVTFLFLPQIDAQLRSITITICEIHNGINCG